MVSPKGNTALAIMQVKTDRPEARERERHGLAGYQLSQSERRSCLTSQNSVRPTGRDFAVKLAVYSLKLLQRRVFHFAIANALIHFPHHPTPLKGEGWGGGDVSLFISFVLVLPSFQHLNIPRPFQKLQHPATVTEAYTIITSFLELLQELISI